mmetsp:Transcript_20226/g.77631  ORF Transcript_20226/g.77631 Transcript_20226/m.77631 type:complete len:214 (-) Transcript_20226:1940-2581(-)
MGSRPRHSRRLPSRPAAQVPQVRPAVVDALEQRLLHRRDEQEGSAGVGPAPPRQGSAPHFLVRAVANPGPAPGGGALFLAPRPLLLPRRGGPRGGRAILRLAGSRVLQQSHADRAGAQQHREAEREHGARAGCRPRVQRRPTCRLAASEALVSRQGPGRGAGRTGRGSGARTRRDRGRAGEGKRISPANGSGGLARAARAVLLAPRGEPGQRR